MKPRPRPKACAIHGCIGDEVDAHLLGALGGGQVVQQQSGDRRLHRHAGDKAW